MNDRKTTNILLLFIVVPLVFYILKTLSFIFIPLVSSMFLALIFLPMMRWLKKKRVPKFINILLVVLIMAASFRVLGAVIQLSSLEFNQTDNEYFDAAKIKLSQLVASLERFFGVDFLKGEDTLKGLISKEAVMKNFMPTVDFVSGTISGILTTIFFVLLLLAESFDVQKVLRSTVIKQQFTSVKAFRKIEKDLLTFIKVKFFVSFLTGLGTGLICLFFGVSFPIFWGLFAFLINFVQMVGSVICVLVVTIFAFVEIESSSMLFFFFLSATGVQAVIGGILEPIFMGKSFSINVVTILIALMLWGYIWGIPGLIMSIPITVFLKILMEQYKNTRVIAQLMSGS
ncbi:MAG: AI-2E family transporter [Roseivirga sp.]|jgi:predicted PurR-regulated permease PerM|uniref:AI-2E family transporter n=1 Tax=Roseivirga sp. TaxID=1964215 RepID=UPI001B153563|nr:AI-2E family transporter [Roseivirga sp.]MBO6662754.1 AI-2E family transporter [Roseivirga sp.]MBO6909868.1 AI-2E family transporter [Roseivirga sp.]